MPPCELFNYKFIRNIFRWPRAIKAAQIRQARQVITGPQVRQAAQVSEVAQVIYNIQKNSPQSYETQIKIVPFPGLA